MIFDLLPLHGLAPGEISYGCTHNQSNNGKPSDSARFHGHLRFLIRRNIIGAGLYVGITGIAPSRLVDGTIPRAQKWSLQGYGQALIFQHIVINIRFAELIKPFLLRHFALLVRHVPRYAVGISPLDEPHKARHGRKPIVIVAGNLLRVAPQQLAGKSRTHEHGVVVHRAGERVVQDGRTGALPVGPPEHVGRPILLVCAGPQDVDRGGMAIDTTCAVSDHVNITLWHIRIAKDDIGGGVYRRYVPIQPGSDHRPIYEGNKGLVQCIRQPLLGRRIERTGPTRTPIGGEGFHRADPVSRPFVVQGVQG